MDEGKEEWDKGKEVERKERGGAKERGGTKEEVGRMERDGAGKMYVEQRKTRGERDAGSGDINREI